jgi:glycosyltransferase involved in cell wall biosynthesis
MKVIMVRSHPINPDARIEKEAHTIANAGYKVTLLGWKRYGDAPENEQRSNYSIHRIRLRAPLGFKVIFFLPLWWILELFWLLHSDWDIVHAADLDTYVPALIAAKIKRKPIVYDIYDFYADTADLPLLIRETVTRIDIFLMKFASAIIIVDPSRLRQIRRNDGSGVYVIYNTPEDTIFLSLKDSLSTKPETPSFKIFFAGVLTFDRDFETIIQAAKELGDVEVEIAGFGYFEERLREISTHESFFTYSGTITHEEVIKRTIHANLLFAFYNPAVPNNIYASPNKLFEAMLCSKPILVSSGTAMADIVHVENCGIVVPFGDLDAIKSAISLLRSDPALSERLGQNGRTAYETKYNWKIMETKLLGIYNQLSSNVHGRAD